MFEEVPDIEDIYSEEDDNRLVTISREEIEEKVCNCPVCEETFKCNDWCKQYNDRLISAFPVGEPIIKHGYEVLPVMGGYIPKKLIDKYTDNIAERLKTVTRERINKCNKYSRPIYLMDELEDERRQLHIAILWNAGFTPLDTGIEATAFKIVIERYVENRLKRLGLL
jgi:hypothetical protein